MMDKISFRSTAHTGMVLLSDIMQNPIPMTLGNMHANGVRKLSVCGSLAILIVIAMTSANSAARKPKEGTTQIHRACGKLPYSSFVECFDHFLKIGYGIKVTAPFCQYYCSR